MEGSNEAMSNWEHQDRGKARIAELRSQGVKAILGVAPPGCHVAGTKVLAFDGSFIAVEDVAVGDVLMGPDSRPRLVEKVSNGMDDLYQIQPLRRQPFIVNAGHVLTLVKSCGHTRVKRGSAYDRSHGDWYDITVSDLVVASKSFSQKLKLFGVSVDFSPASISGLKPYWLGLLLGDGSIKKSVGITTEDDEIIAEIACLAKAYELKVVCRPKPGNKAATYDLSAGRFGSRKHRNKLINELETLGIRGCGSGDKFIPHIYKTASKQNRLELLAGLLDTDGCLSKGAYDFVSKSFQLASDTAFVARSLGFRVKVSKCQKSAHVNHIGTYYRLSICGETEIIPVRIERKKAQPRRIKKDVQRSGFAIEPFGRGMVYGFTLSGDGRYLLEDFTVTHNSGKSRVMMQLTTEEVAKGGSVRLYVHRSMLREQLCGLFEAQGIPYGVQASGCEPDFSQPVQICMLDTVWSRCVKRAGSSDWTLGEPSLVIVDEAHNQMGDKAEGVFVGSNADSESVWHGHKRLGATLLGFTATPVGCSAIYDKLVQFGTYSELRRVSAHLPVRCYSPTEMDLQGVARAANYEFNTAKLTERSYAIFGDAFEWWQKLNPDAEPAILFAPSVEASRWFATKWTERGVPVAHIDGETTLLPRRCPLAGWILEQYDTDEPGIRDELLAMSKSGEVKVICNRFVLREAIDTPWMRHAILATAFGGIATYLQSVGRIQRFFPGHEYKIMQDHGGNYHAHGSPNMERYWDLSDTNRSIAEKRQEAIKKSADPQEVEGICCPKCFCWRREGVRCPSCGHSHKRSVRTVRMVDGELRLQTGSVHKKKSKKTKDCQSIWTGVLFGSAKVDRSVSSAVSIWKARCREAGLFADQTILKNPPPEKSSPAFDLPVSQVYPWTVRKNG